MTANIYFNQGRYQDARIQLERALTEVQFEDAYTVAALTNTLGATYSQLGRTEEAFMMLRKARAMLVDLGMTGEVTRTDWSIARAVLDTGDFTKAVELLRAVRESFLSLSMADDSGLAGLDLADALIGNGQMGDARHLIEEVLREFINKKLNHRAVTALSYLRDVLSTTPRPLNAVDHVRTYLKRLRYEPERIFLPVPEE